MGCIEIMADSDRFKRMDDGSRSAFHRLWALPGVAEALRETVVNSRADDALRLLRHVLRQPLLDDFLPALARRGKHDRVRQIALRCLLRKTYIWKQNRKIQRREIAAPCDPEQLAAEGLRDPSVDVQRVALSYVLGNSQSPLHNEETFRSFLSHRSFSLVEKAVWGLRSLGVDILGEARTQLRSDTPTTASARIVASYGTPEDGPLVYAARRRAVREESFQYLAAAARLSYGLAIGDLTETAVADENLDDARRASRALLAAGETIGFEPLREVIVSGRDFAARGLIPFITKRPLLEAACLTVLMEQAHFDDHCIALWPALARRRNRGAFQPSDSEVSALSEAVGANRRLADKVFNFLGVRVTAQNVVRLK